MAENTNIRHNLRTNKGSCECFNCKYGKELSEEHERNSLELYGWYAHCVTEKDPQSPTGFNIHTHALPELWDHKDLQCCYPMNPQIIMTIWHTLIEDIKKGKRFESEVEYEGYMKGGYKVRFIDAIECGRPVLRMVVPNKEGKYEGGFFAKQMGHIITN